MSLPTQRKNAKHRRLGLLCRRSSIVSIVFFVHVLLISSAIVAGNVATLCEGSQSLNPAGSERFEGTKRIAGQKGFSMCTNIQGAQCMRTCGTFAIRAEDARNAMIAESRRIWYEIREMDRGSGVVHSGATGLPIPPERLARNRPYVRESVNSAVCGSNRKVYPNVYYLRLYNFLHNTTYHVVPMEYCLRRRNRTPAHPSPNIDSVP